MNVGKLAPLTKRDFLAHIWQFVHYIEDFMTGETNYHFPTCKQKCAQLKDMLRQFD